MVHAFDDVDEVVVGVEVMYACGLADGEYGGVAFGSFLAGAEEAVFSVEGVGPHAAFGVVVVDGGVAVCEVGGESVPAREDVVGGFTDAGLW